MLARITTFSFAALLVASSSGCCVRQGAHAITRIWFDCDTYCGPALCLEQVDHLPYHKERVGYFRWMYNKDPGHQYAKLGPLPPRQCCDPDCPTTCDIQGQGGGGIPGSTDFLWKSGTPQPVDPSVFLPPTPPPEGFAPLNGSPGQAPTATSGSRPVSAPNVAPAPSLKLPAGNQPEGPTAQRWGGFKVAGEQVVPMSATANQPIAVPAVPPQEKKSAMPRGEWLLLH